MKCCRKKLKSQHFVHLSVGSQYIYISYFDLVPPYWQLRMPSSNLKTVLLMAKRTYIFTVPQKERMAMNRKSTYEKYCRVSTPMYIYMETNYNVHLSIILCIYAVLFHQEWHILSFVTTCSQLRYTDRLYYLHLHSSDYIIISTAKTPWSLYIGIQRMLDGKHF